MADIRIAFVDDEPHVLSGIRRSLADREDEWDMTFCPTGAEVLKLMAEHPFDVIVSDMRMPGMDGAQLLNTVREHHPDTIRIILSGYADQDSVLRTVGPAHVYLAKPCDPDELQKAVDRQISMRRLLDHPRLRATLAGLANLPSLPSIYLQLQSELLSPGSSAKSVAEIIGRDMAMTAAILKLTNSAFFSTAGNISTPLHAVRLLGLEIIQALVLKIGVFRQFSGNPEVAPLLEALTLHSLSVASLAERIAVAEGADFVISKAAQIAGMLADIGCVVLLDTDPNAYRALVGQVGGDRSLVQLEEQAFGTNHAVLGAYLLGLWGFSEPIIEAVLYGYRPRDCLRRDNLALTALHAARVLGPRFPLLPKDISTECSFDLGYLTEAHCDGHAARWQEIAGVTGKMLRPGCDPLGSGAAL